MTIIEMIVARDDVFNPWDAKTLRVLQLANNDPNVAVELFKHEREHTRRRPGRDNRMIEHVKNIIVGHYFDGHIDHSTMMDALNS